MKLLKKVINVQGGALSLLLISSQCFPFIPPDNIRTPYTSSKD